MLHGPNKKTSSLLNFSASTENKDFFDSTGQFTGKTTEEKGEREAGGGEEGVFTAVKKPCAMLKTRRGQRAS